LTGLTFSLNITPHHCLNYDKIIFVAFDLSQADIASLLDEINAVTVLSAVQFWHN